MSRPVCAIVGAGEGLGRALAAEFARHGMDIALVSRTEIGSSAAAAAARTAAPDAAVRWFAADALVPEALEQVCASIPAAMGEVQVLIYNARGGYTLRAPLEMSYAELDEYYKLEVVGAYAATRALMPAMVARGHGTVMYSSATAALRGSPVNPLYAIGKFGLRALSQSLAKAYGKDGVHVVHMRLDCTLDVPMIREYLGNKFDQEATADCDDVARSYWWVHQQPRSAWSNEVELRPYTEVWTY